MQMNENKMKTVISSIKNHFESSMPDRKLIMDFIIEDLKNRPSFEKILEGDILYTLTKVDKDTTIKGNKYQNYDFRLPNLNMEIEFKATRQGSSGQFDEIINGKPGKGLAEYYLLIATNTSKTKEFLKKCHARKYEMIDENLYNNYVIAIIKRGVAKSI
jgi:hypothetical protein